MNPFADLNDEQRAAVVADGETVIVSAGPGSGKTRVLGARIAYLLDCGVDPDEILGLTFTRSAAANIRAQVEAACGRSVAVHTFHGFAAKHVLKPGERVATEIEAEATLQSLYRGATKRRGAPSITKMISAIINREATNDESIDDDINQTMRVLLSRFADQGLVPTWDLLPRFPKRFETPISNVLIDERQDCTYLETSLVELIADRIFTVGDERQSIMGFRGGNGGINWSGQELALTKSFRFGPSIAQVANAVAADFGGAPIEGVGESRVLAADRAAMLDALSMGLSVAVLCRTHRDCELAAREIGDLAVHIRRDPMDALAMDADRIGDAVAAGKVVVCTVHGAKGREFDVVLVDDSIFAACDSRATREVTEEEHRIKYVAVTRARRVLMLPETEMHLCA